jgi:hypothetical protein
MLDALAKIQDPALLYCRVPKRHSPVVPKIQMNWRFKFAFVHMSWAAGRPILCVQGDTTAVEYPYHSVSSDFCYFGPS